MALGLGSPIPPSYPNDLPLPGVGGYERAESGQSEAGDPMAAVLRGLGASAGQKNNKAFHLFLMSLANAAFAKSRDGPPTVGTTTPPTSTSKTSTTTSTTTSTSTRTTTTTTTTAAPPPPCRLSDWGTWSSCGGAGPDCRGRRTRLRSFTQWSVAGCRGWRLQESQGCQVPGCQCSWGAWDDCKGSCGQGTRRRQRICGRGSEEGRCWLGPCGTSCSLTQWSGWSGCEGRGPDCRGSRTRRRNFETLSAGGCDERLEERKDCRDSSCACGWAPWGHCQGSCGQGTRRRQRLCGRGSEEERCWLRPCATSCTVTQWSGWSGCEGRGPDCRGNRTRRRNFETLSAGGCDERLEERKDCRDSSCVCGWASWGPCQGGCGSGRRERQRLCGSGTQSDSCRLQPCIGFDIDGKRHFFVGTRLANKERIQFCTSLGMTLAAPTSVASLTALAKALKNTGAAFVALHGRFPKGYVPRFATHEWHSGPFDNVRTLKFIAKNLWGPGEPNYNGMCVELNIVTARLSDSGCAAKTPFVCAQLPTPPLSGFVIDGKRHVFFASRKIGRKAQEHCASLGWDLASFDSAESLAELRSALSGTGARSVHFYGGVTNSDDHSLRNFKRISGPWKSIKVLGPIDASLWGPGEPDGRESWHTCVEVDLATARLNDIDCSWPRPFVCVDRG